MAAPSTAGPPSMTVVIASPSAAHEQAFIAMVSDFESHDPENAGFYSGAKRGFERYVQTLVEEEQGLNLSPGRVPCTHRWLLDGEGAVVAVTRLRHNIDTPFLANEAIDRVLLLADESNEASRKTIVRQGGEPRIRHVLEALGAARVPILDPDPR